MGFNFSKLSQIEVGSLSSVSDQQSVTVDNKIPPDLSNSDDDDASDREHKTQRRNSFDKFQQVLLEKRRERQNAMAGIKGELVSLRSVVKEKTNLANQLIAHMEANGLKIPDEFNQQSSSLPSKTSVACQSVTDVVDKQTITDPVIDEPDQTEEPEPKEPPPNLRIELAVAFHDLQQANETILDLQTELKNNKIYAVTNVVDKQTITDTVIDEPDQTEEPEPKEPPRNLRIELAVAFHELQQANETILDLQTELKNTKIYAASLKDVINVSKQMVQVREDQLNELKAKLNNIEATLNEREAELMSTKLREEYMEQLEKMKNLRTLYEERARLSLIERENLQQELAVVREENSLEIEKSKNLEERVLSLEASLLASQEETLDMKNQLSLSKADTRDLQAQISVINLLFSQVILGATASENGERAAPMMDFDKLIVVLEEHRGLLNDITMDDDSFDGAAYFPKLLYDLINQNGDEECEAPVEEGAGSEEVKPRNVKITEIAEKLPKVWKVFIEFLSHQKEQTAVPISSETASDSAEIGTSSQTAVISVSKTFLKLKDLIVEKKELQKQTNRLKALNTHLEKRLQSQENRLGTVCVELSKTWNVVGRMQRQHRQLHTNEQVLRYQLYQKRRLLNELKEELEYCRRKWSAARQKNNDTEAQWRVLRTEFTNRKLADREEANQQSAESGYSGDEQMSDDDALERKPEFVEVKASFQDSETAAFKPVKEIPKIPRNRPETAEEMFMRLTGQTFEVEEVPEEASTATTEILKTEEFVIEQDTEELFDLEVPMPIPCSFSGPTQVDSSPPTSHQTPDSLTMEEDEHPAPSSSHQIYKLTITEEEYLDRRQRRLERLEKEAAEFHKRMSSNRDRSSKMCTKLDDLHDRYSQGRKQRDKKTADGGEASTSRRPKPVKMDGTIKILTDAEMKYTENRADRIQNLEEQCNDLMTQIRTTTSRGSALAEQLDSLHSRSVESEMRSRFGGRSEDRESSTDSSTVETESVAERIDRDELTINEETVVELNAEEEFDELIRNANAELNADDEFDELIENAEAELTAADSNARLEELFSFNDLIENYGGNEESTEPPEFQEQNDLIEVGNEEIDDSEVESASEVVIESVINDERLLENQNTTEQ